MATPMGILIKKVTAGQNRVANALMRDNAIAVYLTSETRVRSTPYPTCTYVHT